MSADMRSAHAFPREASSTVMPLATPALLLDRQRMRANAKRLSERIAALGGVLRPHVKTHKCIELTRDIIAAGYTRGVTVSTLKEAEYFYDHGITDILYAVGISPNKFAQAGNLIARGCRLCLTLDNAFMARALSEDGNARGVSFPVLIELDTDGHRAGTCPEGDALLAIAEALARGKGTELRGVMTHAGESYGCRTAEALLDIARKERDRSLFAASRLREAGHDCPVVSIGSTPTAFAIDDLTGITEVRAGVYATFDLVMAGIGVCSLEDIALSVLVSVIGHRPDKNWLITDGGWMALSRDRGTADQAVDYGYGAVLDTRAQPLPLQMHAANQEHGIISPATADGSIDFEAFPLGSQLRILPNHACATAGQHRHFDVLEEGQPIARWSRCGGW